MNEDEFIDDCVKELFARGLIPPYEEDVLAYFQTQYGDIEDISSEADFIKECIVEFKLTTAGAFRDWLAVHEAGHAIVGLKFGLPLRGVRFCDGGTKGEAVFPRDPEWRKSKNETIIRKLIAVDVAGLVAENLMHVCHDGNNESEPRLSTYYSGPLEFVSSDFRDENGAGADEKTACLAKALFELEGHLPTNDEFTARKRCIMEEAEAEVEKILRCELETLKKLSAKLLKGPLTGTAVKQIVDGGDS